MWMAVGVLYVTLFKNLGGVHSIDQTVPVNERFETREQCTAYVDGLTASLQKTPRSMMKAAVECVSIPGARN